jgi:hypothetical protein
MITQAIKGWLQKMFAWWPWKQSTPMEYQHVASPMTRNSPPEMNFWPDRGDGTASQTGITPRLSTLESHAEWSTQARPEVFNLSLQSIPISAGGSDTEIVLDEQTQKNAPNTRQRLEFLRYLVERGIVNEGFEQEKSDNQE